MELKISFLYRQLSFPRKQEGNYQIDISMGMMMKGGCSANLEGSVQAAGRKISVTISIKVKIEGKKLF
jgi:hypothetical protein